MAADFQADQLTSVQPGDNVAIFHRRRRVPRFQHPSLPKAVSASSLQSEYDPRFQNSRNAATSRVPVQIAMRQRRSLVPLAALLPL